MIWVSLLNVHVICSDPNILDAQHNHDHSVYVIVVGYFSNPSVFCVCTVQKGLKALDVCPDGDCKIMLYDYEEGGNPNAPTEDHDL